MKKLLLYIVCLGIFPVYLLQAQSAYIVDTAFAQNFPDWYPYPDEPELSVGLFRTSDDNYMLYGDFTLQEQQFVIIASKMHKFFADGTTDTTFSYAGIPVDYVQKAPYGYLVSEVFILNKYSFTGAEIDPAFWQNQLDSTFPGFLGGPEYLAPDGFIWKGGQPPYTLFRITSQGTFDYSFTHDVGNSDFISNIQPYTDSMVLIMGRISTYDSIPVNDIVRVDLDGNIDTSFHHPFTWTWSWSSGGVYLVYTDSLERLYLRGNFVIPNFADTLKLVRLWPDGSLDTTFNNTGYTYHYPAAISRGIGAICPTDDGGYLMGGWFYSYDGYARNNIVKTDANGFIDTNYFSGGGFDVIPPDSDGIFTPDVNAILPVPNEDAYIVVGCFNFYNGQPVNPSIVKLKHTTVGIPKVKPMAAFGMYPNPATDIVRIELPKLPENAQAAIVIYNIQGQIVKQQHTTGKNNVLNLSALQAGVYLVTINSKEKIFKAKKLIIR